MPTQSTHSTLSTLFGALVALAAAWAARQVVASAWKAATGHRPPMADDEGEAGLAEVAAAAAITGAVIALVRMLATRAAVRALR